MKLNISHSQVVLRDVNEPLDPFINRKEHFSKDVHRVSPTAHFENDISVYGEFVVRGRQGNHCHSRSTRYQHLPPQSTNEGRN